MKITRGNGSKWLILCLPAFLAGCATIPKGAEFSDVQREIGDRTGQQVQWRGHSADDASVDAAVHALLQKELNVDQAVQIALLNNRNLQATFEDLGIAQADLVQAGLLKNPVFDLSVRIPDRRPSKTYLDFSVAESFLDIFLIPMRKKLADAQFQQAKARVANEVLTLAAQTAAAFYRYQAIQQTVELRRNIAATAAASLDAAKKLHDAGNIDELNYINEQAQEARATVDLTNAEADAGEQREKLNVLMGLWGQEAAWKVTARLPDLPPAEIDPHGLEELALRQRLDLAASRQEIETQARALGLTRQTRFFTDVSVGPEAERETDGQWRIGPTISAPLPIFDQGQAAIPRASALLSQSQQRYIALAVEIRSEVRTAQIRLLNARSKTTLYHDKILPLQRQLLDQTQLQYNGMFVGVFQLLQAKRDEIDAAREYIEALRDYWIARAELQRAIGGRLPIIEPATHPAPQTIPPTNSHGESK